MKAEKKEIKKKKQATYQADMEVLFLHHPRNRNHPMRVAMLKEFFKNLTPLENKLK